MALLQSLTRLQSGRQLAWALSGDSGEWGWGGRNLLPGSLRLLGLGAIITAVFQTRKLKPRDVLYLPWDDVIPGQVS